MYKKILIVKPSSLGDIANAMVVIPQLHQFFPGVKIDWLANSEYAGLVSLAEIDQVIKFDRSIWRQKFGFFKGSISFLKLLWKLKKNKYDLVIDLQGLLRSGLFSWVTFAKRRIGFADAREGATFFYTDKIEVNRSTTHAVDCYLKTIAALGPKSPASWSWPNLEPISTALQKKLAIQDYFVFVVGARWDTKQWPATWFAELSLLLWQKYKLPIIISGTADESSVAAEVISAIKEDSDIKIISMAGKLNIPELAALCRNSRLVVSGDTGPLHLADAVGAKAIALMGATNPVKHGPYQQKENLIYIDLDCNPCHKRKCPSGDARCMRLITPEMVFEKSNSELSKSL